MANGITNGMGFIEQGNRREEEKNDYNQSRGSQHKQLGLVKTRYGWVGLKGLFCHFSRKISP